ncbi:hypothetical protein AB6A40_006210 [Gnathostoma spinigerum]|uniref:Uncharacterized protein n=1 Tax=Gnathostoma spinigerum TaxID=75299 RepID=A0ABD6EJT2_9BILA
MGSKGDFKDPTSDLPELLGFCNRISCGDIYKAIDQFRKSEFFTNFQLALGLIQDPKGWEILGELLSHPELIAQFTGGDANGIGSIFGSKSGSRSKVGNNAKEIVPGDGDLGTDFSEMVGEKRHSKPRKPTAEQLPEIAENVDSIDYYNAVESGTGDNIEGGVEVIGKPDEVVPPINKPSSMETRKSIEIDVSLPEISESIDEGGETVETIHVDKTLFGGTVLTVSKTTENPRNSSAMKTHRTVLRPVQPWSLPPTPPDLETVAPWSTSKSYTIGYTSLTTRSPRIRTSTTIHSLRGSGRTSTTMIPSRTTRKSRVRPTTTLSWKRLSTKQTTKRTTRNFRRESDYYAMYYDDDDND